MSRTVHRLIVTLLVVAALAASGATRLAHAADGDDPAARFSTLAAEAEAAYAARNYEAAVDKYLAAYEVLPSSDVLYNVAWIYEDSMGRRDLARNFYERIVRSPDSRAELVKLANERLAIIAKKDAEVGVRPPLLGNGGERPPGDVPANNVDQQLPPPKDDGPGVGPWLLVGTGGAMILGGLYAGSKAFDAQEDMEGIDVVDEESLEAVRAEIDEGETAAAVADVLIFGGAAVAIGGIIWYLVADSDEPASSGSVMFQPSIGPGAVSAELTLSF